MADQVLHVRVLLDDVLLGHPDRADLRDAPDVVAREVDQHQVLGPLLRIGGQFGREDRIVLGGIAARPGAGDRPDRDHPLALAVLAADEDLGRSAHHVKVAEVVEVHVRRRV